MYLKYEKVSKEVKSKLENLSLRERGHVASLRQQRQSAGDRADGRDRPISLSREETHWDSELSFLIVNGVHLILHVRR